MPFAARLSQSLDECDLLSRIELAGHDSLEDTLSRYLLAAEANCRDKILTSILLLSDDGKRLTHGAAPNLPQAYQEAIDGVEIGPCAGSCGTAAYLNRAVYVSDIATDPLWADYRDLALSHDLRSCWSTPIHDGAGSVVGTFAIYGRTPQRPTGNALRSIATITRYVEAAIVRAKSGERSNNRGSHLRLVSDNDATPETQDGPFASLLTKISDLETLTDEMEQAARSSDPDTSAKMRDVVLDGTKLAEIIRSQVAGP